MIRENLDKNLALYKIEIFAENDFVLYEILNKNNNYEVSLSNDNNRYYINDATFSNLKEAIDNIIK